MHLVQIKELKLLCLKGLTLFCLNLWRLRFFLINTFLVPLFN